MLIQTLDYVLRLSRLETDLEPGYDGSQYWCRRVDVADDYESSPRSHVVHALVRACEGLIEESPARFGELDSLLRAQKWKVFSRIRWHTYGRFPTTAKETMRQDILGVKCYGDGDYGYEFAVMLRIAAEQRLLSHQEFQNIFDQILKGPDLIQHRERFVSAVGREPTEQEDQSFLNHVYLRQMSPFRDVLPEFPSLWQRYQQLLQQKKEVSEEDYCGIGRAVSYEVVPRSPVSVEELESKSDDELIRYLDIWKPPKGSFDEPSVSGLSGTFATVVRRNPDRFFRIAGQLKLREPTYVRDFLYFCGERAQKKESLPWTGILELGRWLVGNNPRIAEPRAAASENDDFANLDWTSSREALARLLSLGFGNYTEAIPFELRSPVFGLLRHLVTEFDPRLEGEQMEEGLGRDLVNRAINSVRGEATQALVEHALWIKRHLKKSGQASVSMQDMPEVRDLFEARLDVNQEPSKSVRSVYGRLTPWLCHLDVEWFRHVSGLIFPESEALTSYWLAAWNTYVRYIHPDILLFDVIESNYRRAVDLVGSDPESEVQREATEGLGRHLIRLYWWGRIPLSSADSLLAKFLTKVNPKGRAHVMNHVGRSLEKDDQVPNEIRLRLQDYWASRLATAKAAEKRGDFSEELCEFAWWYRSGKLEEKWCLDQVGQYLEVITKLDDSTFLIEALAKSCERHPKESVGCFFRAVQRMSQQQYFYVREDEAKQILRVALVNQDLDVREIGMRAQDLLLRLGRFEFKSI